MKLITKDIERQLKANNMKDTLGRPVVKLFGGGAFTWLISFWLAGVRVVNTQNSITFIKHQTGKIASNKTSTTFYIYFVHSLFPDAKIYN